MTKSSTVYFKRCKQGCLKGCVELWLWFRAAPPLDSKWFRSIFQQLFHPVCGSLLWSPCTIKEKSTYCECFAGPGLSDANHVFATQSHRPALRLDGSWFGPVLLANDLHDIAWRKEVPFQTSKRASVTHSITFSSKCLSSICVI